MAGHGPMREQQEQQGLPGPDAEGHNSSRALLSMPTSTASLQSLSLGMELILRASPSTTRTHDLPGRATPPV